MFCSRCGQVVLEGSPFCSQCGLAVAPVAPPVPGLEFQLEAYNGKIKALSICWFVYAGVSLLLGWLGLVFIRDIFGGVFGHLGSDSLPHHFFGPSYVHLFWGMHAMRSVLAIAAGWGLWQRSSWGRVVAIIAAVCCLLKFPFGTALGIWTLALLLGYRNTTLYEQL